MLPDFEHLEHFPRIEDPVRIERVLHRLHGLHLRWRMLQPQEDERTRTRKILQEAIRRAEGDTDADTLRSIEGDTTMALMEAASAPKGE